MERLFLRLKELILLLPPSRRKRRDRLRGGISFTDSRLRTFGRHPDASGAR